VETELQMLLPGLEQIASAEADSLPGRLYRGKDLGTFKDSLRSPVYRWFKYPAGYSYKFVQVSFDLFGVSHGDWVYDPFSGTGTTLICAKQRGINAYGVEAHSFVHWVAEVKLRWDYDLDCLEQELDGFLVESRACVKSRIGDIDLTDAFPELVYKCYHPQDLKVLYILREFIRNTVHTPFVKDFLKLALTDSLRSAAVAGTGWPYIAPRKGNDGRQPKDAFAVFQKTVRQMYSDLRAVQAITRETPSCEIRNVLGDSRERQDLADGQIKLALTSPPYLNNYDYADRTRLETYFWGIAHSWRDITRKFRDKLMTAATTQITRGLYDVEATLSQEINQAAAHVYELLQQSILQLAKLRLQKGGKKDYDLMVALYFNDILRVLKETYRVLEPGGRFCLVLGDSAPYGVHIQTDQMIGELGLGLGFRNFEYDELRKRGGKWKGNPQRHRVPLREGVVVLTK